MRLPGSRPAPFPVREAAHLALGGLTGLGLLGSLVLAIATTPLAGMVPTVPLRASRWLARLVELEGTRSWAVLREPVRFLAPVPEGSEVRERWLSIVSRPDYRCAMGYAGLRLPLSVLQLLVVTAVVSWPALLLATLVQGVASGAFPAAGPFAREAAGWPAVAILAAVALVGLLAGSPAVIRLLTRFDLLVMRGLLGGPDAETEQRIGELVSSRRWAVNQADAERARIERDLHDGAQQRLIALGVSLGRAEARLRRDDPGGETLTLVTAAKTETLEAIAELRTLTRGLRSPILDSRGLDASLSAVIARLQLPARLRVEVDRLDATAEAVLYFGLLECLTNVARHAPGAAVAITVERIGPIVRAEVTDAGPGGASLDGGSGLQGIADRLAGVDGRLRLSSPAGGPTLVRLEVPCG